MKYFTRSQFQEYLLVRQCPKWVRNQFLSFAGVVIFLFETSTGMINAGFWLSELVSNLRNKPPHFNKPEEELLN